MNSTMIITGIRPCWPAKTVLHWKESALILPTACIQLDIRCRCMPDMEHPDTKIPNTQSDSASRTDFISVEPKVFSPDMDGYQDFFFIHYHLPAAGFTGSISIYDIYGRMVRKLVNNILWGTSGSFRWDGLDEQQNLLPMGHYLIYAELFLPGWNGYKTETRLLRWQDAEDKCGSMEVWKYGSYGY